MLERRARGREHADDVGFPLDPRIRNGQRRAAEVRQRLASIARVNVQNASSTCTCAMVTDRDRR